MKKIPFTFRTLICISALGTLLWLPSCRADIDLNDIDPSAQVQLGLALPIGEMKVTINDFLKGELKDLIGVEEDGLLYYEDTFNIKRDFHNIDLTRYISSVKKQFLIGDAQPSLVGHNISAGTQVVLDFPLTMELTDINSALDEERIDSIYIREARFSTLLSVTDLDLPYSSIKKLEIILSDNISRPAGKIVEIPLTNGGYNDSIHILIDEFTINLMKDRTQEPSNKNVLSSVDFTFRFTIQPEKDTPINAKSSINYDFKVQFLDYNAIWGIFKPSNLMHDCDTIDLSKEWDGWESIDRFNLKLAEPRITIHSTQALGCPLTANLDYFFVSSQRDDKIEFATFNGNQKYIWALPLFVDPRTSPIGETVTNTLVLDHTEPNGRLDKLFEIRPDMIGYKFEILINQSYSSTLKQHRLTKNTDVEIEAIAHLPFLFNPGVEVAYSDTLKDIHINQSSIDSIIDNSKIIDSLHINELKLVLMATNYIPFNVNATFHFYDENGEEIHFNNLLEDDSNTVKIAGPTKVENRVVIEPGKTNVVIRIDQAEYEKLKSLSYIVYDLFLGENTVSVRLLDRSELRIKIGLAADVKALLNFDFDKNKEE